MIDKSIDDQEKDEDFIVKMQQEIKNKDNDG